MDTLKSKVLIAALALAMSPLLATPQGAPSGQSGALNPPAPGRGQAQTQLDAQSQSQWRHARRHHRRHRPWRRHRRMAMLLRNPVVRERLGITPEQAARIQTQQSAFAKTMIRSRADVQVKRLELAELMAAEKPDRALISSKLRELSEAQLAARQSAIDHRLAMREMLTLEQREKLRELVREWQARRIHGG